MDDEVVAARFGEAVSWLIRRPHEEQPVQPLREVVLPFCHMQHSNHCK